MSTQCDYLVIEGGFNITDQQFDRGIEASGQKRGLVDCRLSSCFRWINDNQDVADLIHAVQSSYEAAVWHIRNCAYRARATTQIGATKTI